MEVAWVIGELKQTEKIFDLVSLFSNELRLDGSAKKQANVLRRNCYLDNLASGLTNVANLQL